MCNIIAVKKRFDEKGALPLSKIGIKPFLGGARRLVGVWAPSPPGFLRGVVTLS